MSVMYRHSSLHCEVTVYSHPVNRIDGAYPVKLHANIYYHISLVVTSRPSE